MYNVWAKHFKLKMTPHPDPLFQSLAAKKHTNGNLLHVRYAMEGTSWSKYKAKSATVEGTDELWYPKFIEHLNTVFESRNDAVIYIQNNDDLQMLVHGINLPVKSHGLNHWTGYHNAVYLAATNLNTSDRGFWSHLGLTGDDITAALNHQTAYQFVLRSSLRDPGDTNDKVVVVMDKDTADYIASRFPGCTNQSLDLQFQIKKTKPVVKQNDGPKRAPGRPKNSVTKEQNMKTCSHCGVSVAPNTYVRWHGDNCKSKP